MIRRGPKDSRIFLGGGITIQSGQGGATFSPLDVSGLVAWYDFSDITTLFTDTSRTIPVTVDGDVIGGVTDKSGNGKHATQATAARKPLYKTGIQNGLSIGRGDATDDALGISVAVTNETILAVTRHAVNEAANATIISVATTYRLLYSTSVADRIDYVYNTAVRSATGEAATDFNLAVGKYDGTNSHIYVDGVLNASGTATSAAHTYVSIFARNATGSDRLNGDIAEILIYDRAVTDGELASLSAYLNSKWVLY